MLVFVKICGLICLDGVDVVVKVGVCYLGFVFFLKFFWYVIVVEVVVLVVDVFLGIVWVGLFVNLDDVLLESMLVLVLLDVI